MGDPRADRDLPAPPAGTARGHRARHVRERDRTLHHIISAGDYYRTLLAGVERRWRSADPVPPLDELARRAEELAAFWEAFLAEPFDPERIVVDEGGRLEIRAGVLLAQALTHGTDHRTQVLTILTTLGVEHPDLDAWDYGRATGRVRSI
ncbi:MAG TPA: DinB family protein [Actinomycetota bacterium]|nr:DinB family protein [Actinomycetota bacterium]